MKYLEQKSELRVLFVRAMKLRHRVPFALYTWSLAVSRTTRHHCQTSIMEETRAPLHRKQMCLSTTCYPMFLSQSRRAVYPCSAQTSFYQALRPTNLRIAGVSSGSTNGRVRLAGSCVPSGRRGIASLLLGRSTGTTFCCWTRMSAIHCRK